MSKEKKTKKARPVTLRMTKAQKKQHDRDYRTWLIRKGLLRPRTEEGQVH